MKKKVLLNICMVIIVILVAVSGIMTVGSIKGWFQDAEEIDTVVSEKTGIATIERSGIVYEVKKDTAVRAGDIFATKPKATIIISKNAVPVLYMGGDVEVSVVDTKDPFSIEADKGEILVDARTLEDMQIVSGDSTIHMGQAVASISSQAGTSMVRVYSGTVELTQNDTGDVTAISAGQVVSVVQDSEITSAKLDVNSLSDELIEQLIVCGVDDSFSFTEDELKTVLEKRKEEILLAQQVLLGGENEEEASETEEAADIKDTGEESSSETENSETDSSTENATHENNGSNTGTENTTQDSQNSNSNQEEQEQTSSKPESEEPQTQDTNKYCTLEIRCDTILDNMENLEPGLEGYVPSNGTILSTTRMAFTEGETVFDVLNRACSSLGIQIEYSWTPMYNSYYIEGINHLYEFSCGNESGWMYKVNGWFPNYGCSSYTLQDGDVIVWCYTCNGLGADVGGSVY